MSPAASAPLSKVLRMMLQSAVLGVGAYLVIQRQATRRRHHRRLDPAARALAPVELAIANWRGFVGARQSWRRLNELLLALPPEASRWRCRRRQQRCSVESLAVGAARHQQGRSSATSASRCRPATALGVIGPSASGKSSLVRALVGVWPPLRGKHPARRRGARSMGARGARPRISATCRRTSSCSTAPSPRTSPASSPTPTRQASSRRRRRPACTTDPAPAGRLRDADRRKRRRALGRPAPAHRAGPRALRRSVPGRARRAQLQSRREGEEALTEAIRGVRARGGIVIVVAHRPSALAAVDQVLVLSRRPRRRPSARRTRSCAQVLQAAHRAGAAGPTPAAHRPRGRQDEQGHDA